MRNLMVAGGAMVLVFLLVVAGWWWQRKRAGSKPAPGIVLLVRALPKVDGKRLAEIAGKAFDPPRQIEVAGEPPHALLPIDGDSYVAHVIDHPYVSADDPALGEIAAGPVREAIAAHRAWIAIDLIGPKQATAEQYRLMGRIVAGLVDEQYAGLYHPETNRFAAPPREEAVAALRGPDPVAALFASAGENFVQVDSDEPELRAAEAEARRRFPEFEAAFRSGKMAPCAVKALLTSPGGGEHIWIEVDEIRDGRIYGRLANEPRHLTGMRLDSPASVAIGEIEDWAFTRDGETVGGFTVAVIRRMQK